MVDEAHKALFEHILHEKHRGQNAEDFMGISGQDMETFLRTFYLDTESHGTSFDRSTLIIGFDYKIEEETGEPVMIEMNDAPLSTLGRIATIDSHSLHQFLRGLVQAKGKEDYFEKDISEHPGFSEFVPLEKLIEIWQEFDHEGPMGCSQDLTYAAIYKNATHKLLDQYMAQIVNPQTVDPDTLIVRKPTAGAKGESIEIGKASEFLEDKKLRDPFTLWEKYVSGQPHVEDGAEYETCYRTVVMVGMQDGVPTAKPVVTYKRVSPTPRDADVDESQKLVVNVSKGGSKILASPEEATLLEDKSLEILDTYFTGYDAGKRWNK